MKPADPFHSETTPGLKFTPLEFETLAKALSLAFLLGVKIYSVGVWNRAFCKRFKIDFLLKFTPLEFETQEKWKARPKRSELKFTPLEFETAANKSMFILQYHVKIYSVGVWNMNGKFPLRAALAPLKFTPLEFETLLRIIGKKEVLS